MNILETRITELLDRVASAVDVHPDLDAATRDAPQLLAPSAELRRPTRTRALVGGLAAATLLLAAGLAVADQRRVERPSATVAALDATKPVLDYLPAGIEAAWGATGTSTDLARFPSLLLGQVSAADETALILVQFMEPGGAITTEQNPSYGTPRTVSIGPRPDGIAAAERFENSGGRVLIQVHTADGVLLVWGFTGQEDVMVLVAGSVDVADDGALHLSTTPDGYEELGRVEPGLPVGETSHVFFAPPPGTEGPDLLVTVLSGVDPSYGLVTSLGYEPVVRTRIGGHDAWETPTMSAVVAQVAPSVFVRVQSSYFTQEELNSIAAGVRLVDEATFVATYPAG